MGVPSSGFSALNPSFPGLWAALTPFTATRNRGPVFFFCFKGGPKGGRQGDVTGGIGSGADNNCWRLPRIAGFDNGEICDDHARGRLARSPGADRENPPGGRGRGAPMRAGTTYSLHTEQTIICRSFAQEPVAQAFVLKPSAAGKAPRRLPPAANPRASEGPRDLSAPFQWRSKL